MPITICLITMLAFNSSSIVGFNWKARK